MILLALALVMGAPASPIRWQPLGEPGCGGAMTSIRVSPHDSRIVLVGGDMLGIGLSRDGGNTWEATTLPGTYEIADITFHPRYPKTVWAGTMSGPIVSQDGGRTWTLRRNGFPPVSDGMYTAPVEVVLFDPRRPQRLLAFGGSSRRWQGPGKPLLGVVWESTNSGASWSRLSTIPSSGGVNIVDAEFAGTALYALCDGVGFFVSGDGGRTWVARNQGLPHGNVERLAVHPTNPSVAWVSLNNHRSGSEGTFSPGGVFKTLDGGRTWSESSKGLSRVATNDPNFTARYIPIAVSRTDPNVLYTNDSAWNTGVTYRSVNGGASWQAVATRQNLGNDADHPERRTAFRPEIAMFAGLGAVVIEVDPKNANTAFSINSEFILRTRDRGKTWSDASSYKTPNGLWRGRGYTGWCATNIAFDPYRRARMIVQALDAGRAWLSEDGGRTWRYGSGFDSPWFAGVDLAWAKNGHAVAAYGQFSNFQGIGLSSDGGRTWRTIAGAMHGLPEKGSTGDPTAVAIDPDDPNRLWAAIGGRLFASKDGTRFSVLEATPGVEDVLLRGNRLYVTGSHGLEVSDNGGPFRNLGGPKPAHELAIDSAGRVYVTSWRTDSGGLWRLSAGKWERLLDDRFIRSVAVDPANPDRLALTTHQDPFVDVSPATGVWLSSDRGRTWGRANHGLGMRRGKPIAFDPFDSERLVFGTVGRGFWMTRWPKSYRPVGEKTYRSGPQDEAMAAVIAPRTPGVPTLENGAMTLGDSVPQGWDQKWIGRGEVTGVRDTGVFRSAPASLRVDCAANSQGQISSVLGGSPGDSFRVRGQLRSRGKLVASVAVQPFRQDWTPMPSIQVGFAMNDTDWTVFSKEVTLPPGTARFMLGVFVEGEGQAWLDDVQLLPPTSVH
jgi:photosystem II stability/assembly factor-like uncharacterized protein